MSFKATGPKTRPDPVKPPRPSSPTTTLPQPPSWTKQAGSRRSSTSSTNSDASFHSARFAPLEESTMIESSHKLKAEANTQFAKQDYTQAISTYDRALAELPNYLDYEMAVLQSNIAACHLKLEQWKLAVQSCEKGLDGLERELPIQPKKKNNKSKSKNKNKSPQSGQKAGLNSDTESDVETSVPIPSQSQDQIVELDSSADEAEVLANLNLSDQRRADIHRIRTKLLLRRARARSCLPNASKTTDPEEVNDKSKPRLNTDFTSTWSTLSAALADYQLLATPPYFDTLPTTDQKTVRQALVTLPPQVEKAKEKEVGEMMAKLKDLGNGILKPFGLSTDMFKVQQGEGGGYSLNFDAGGGKK